MMFFPFETIMGAKLFASTESWQLNGKKGLS